MLRMSDVSKKIGETTFVFLDVETTGLSPQFGDRICELALLQWRDGQVLATFHSLVNPGRLMSRAASAVNGITDAMLEQAPYFHDIAGDVMKFMQDSVLVAHNAPFDISFVNAHLRGMNLLPLDHTVIDTLALARRCYKFPSNSLGNIAKALEIPVSDEHRAMGDVKTTSRVFERFLSDFKNRGIEDIGQLIGIQGGEIMLPPPAKPVLPTLLEEAIKNQGQVFIRYLSEYNEEITRIVKPALVRNEACRTVLVARCEFKDTEFTVPLENILEIKPLPNQPVQENI
jgi:DNA polymerase III epsilon subunit family exonuclease